MQDICQFLLTILEVTPDKYVVFIIYKIDEINCDMIFFFDINVDVKRIIIFG